MKLRVLTLLTLIVLAPTFGWASESTAYKFGLADLEPILEEELAEFGAGDSIKLESLSIITPDNKIFYRGEFNEFRKHTGFSEADGNKLVLADLKFDKSNKRFNAVLRLPADLKKNKTNGTIEVRGKYQNIIEIPTLGRRLLKGDLIKQEDLEWVEIPENKLRDGTVREKGKLIGKILKRRLSVGRPIKERDVSMPRIIDKGNLVEMIYKSGNIELKTNGRALENGAVGDVIRLRNESSGKIINAEVQPSGVVIVNYGSTPDWENFSETRATRLLKEGGEG